MCIRDRASTIAMAGASILLIFEPPKNVIHEIEWTTIFFFIGLFIIIGGVEKVGLIKWIANHILDITGGNLQLTTLMILWVSGFLSAIIDNIPYTATMIPLIKQLGGSMPVEPLWWALALGACLGGNATIIGASANVIVCDISNSTGYKISFMTFLKYGILVTVTSLLICSIYLWVFYLI